MQTFTGRLYFEMLLLQLSKIPDGAFVAVNDNPFFTDEMFSLHSMSIWHGLHDGVTWQENGDFEFVSADGTVTNRSRILVDSIPIKKKKDREQFEIDDLGLCSQIMWKMIKRPNVTIFCPKE